MLKTLVAISFLSIWCPLFVGILVYKKLDADFKLFFYFQIFSFLTDCLNYYLFTQLKNNIWVMNVFNLIEFFILFFIAIRLSRSKHPKRILLPSLVIFSTLWVYLILIKNSLFESNDLLNGIQSLSMICISCYALIKISEQVHVSILSNESFWLLSGIIIYFAGTFVVYSILNEIIHASDSRMDEAWCVLDVLNICSNLLYAKAYLCHSRKTI